MATPLSVLAAHTRSKIAAMPWLPNRPGRGFPGRARSVSSGRNLVRDHQLPRPLVDDAELAQGHALPDGRDRGGLDRPGRVGRRVR